MDSGLLLFLLFLLYLAPTLVAGIRNHRNVVAILALNILLGWTLIGWVAALVWSLTSQDHDAATARR